SAKTETKAPATTAAPRGRPRTFDRESVLACATQLFWAKGYEATSIADLTEAMGIGSPSLYAAFGSKQELYVEALRHYHARYSGFVWNNFFAAQTAREAVASFLLDSAAALTGEVADVPRGCMLTLSSVGSEGHAELGELVRTARAMALTRLEERITRAVADGELPPSTDVHARARFIQTIQSGMSLLARDGARRSELEAVAHRAMLSWDAEQGSP
ncbi:MAG TPA: TetR/AcrR family transcriptional regulator, partial [Polyangiaceae bacterium]|nr:TetR/AcrR family transcriptional regulator [Polyangiaceae bacterium]